MAAMEKGGRESCRITEQFRGGYRTLILYAIDIPVLGMMA
jgi:hypothetical protein